MPHLYITDLDGTLLDNTTQVNAESAAIISDLSARGALVTVATARTPATVEKLIEHTDIRIPAIVMTGAALWDKQLQCYIEPHLLGSTEVATALDIFERNHLQPFVYTIRHQLLEVFHHGPMTPEETTFVSQRDGLPLKKFLLNSSAEQVRQAQNVILIFGMGSHEQLDPIATQLEAAGEYSVSFYEDNASPQYYIEVFAAGVSKAAAVRQLARRVGADRITVYGDNLNDISMMEIADDSVAVGNARSEVKKRATRQIGPNTESAVARDMKAQFELENPLVTVVVITYNQADSIGQTLDSILSQQTEYPYEILVGDDASTDATRRICEEYASRHPDRIRLMPKAPNKGIVRNYFDCVSAARGKYIADCAGDDRWCDPLKINRMVAVLESEPEVSAVFGDARFVYPDNPSLNWSTAGSNAHAKWRAGRFNGIDILHAVLDNTNALPYILSTGIYRRDIVMTTLRSAPDAMCNPDFGIEDIPVIAAAAAAGDIVHLPGDNLEYVQRNESVSNSTNLDKLIRFYCGSLRCSAALGRHYGIPQSQLANVHRSKTDYLTAAAFNSGNPEMRDLVEETLKEWVLPLSFKARLHTALMRNPTLWKTARKLKQKIIFRNN